MRYTGISMCKHAVRSAPVTAVLHIHTCPNCDQCEDLGGRESCGRTYTRRVVAVHAVHLCKGCSA
eukprot:366301-Chlamydomonas_euryale.AAC.65